MFCLVSVHYRYSVLSWFITVVLSCLCSGLSLFITHVLSFFHSLPVFCLAFVHYRCSVLSTLNAAFTGVLSSIVSVVNQSVSVLTPSSAKRATREALSLPAFHPTIPRSRLSLLSPNFLFRFLSLSTFFSDHLYVCLFQLLRCLSRRLFF